MVAVDVPKSLQFYGMIGHRNLLTVNYDHLQGVVIQQ